VIIASNTLAGEVMPVRHPIPRRKFFSPWTVCLSTSLGAFHCLLCVSPVWSSSHYEGPRQHLSELTDLRQFRHGSAPISQLALRSDCAWVGTIRVSGATPAISRMILVLITSTNWWRSRTGIMNAPAPPITQSR
jgi:hypothetical protein